MIAPGLVRACGVRCTLSISAGVTPPSPSLPLSHPPSHFPGSQASQTSFTICANKDDPLGYSDCVDGARPPSQKQPSSSLNDVHVG
jgi:hypothetical protein